MKPPAWCCHPGRTACTTLTSGENDTTWDAGLYKAKPVGGYLVPVNMVELAAPGLSLAALVVAMAVAVVVVRRYRA